MTAAGILLMIRRQRHSRSFVLPGLLLCLAVAGRSAAHGTQTVTGLAVWTAGENPHRVEGTVTVEKGGRLIIDAGAIVYFSADYRSGIVVNGALTVSGRADARVFLGTAESHQSAQAAVPDWPPKYWRGIQIQDATGPSSLTYVVVAKALTGVAASNSLLEVTNSEFTACGRGLLVSGSEGSHRISSSRFVRNSFGIDILAGAAVEIRDNVFEKNRIAINGPRAVPIPLSNTYLSNDYDVFQGLESATLDPRSALSGTVVRPLKAAVGSRPRAATSVSADITIDTHWTLAESPVTITGPVRISSGVTLTIDPGVIVKFSVGASAELIVNGALVGPGQPDNPIWFTSALDSETTWQGSAMLPPGTGAARVADWSGIRFASAMPGSSLQNVIVRYAATGLNITGPAGNTAPALTGNILADNAIGLQFYIPGGTLTVSAHTFLRNGIGLEIDIGTVTVNGSSFSGNVSGVLLRGGTGNVSGNTFTGSTTAIQADPGAGGEHYQQHHHNGGQPNGAIPPPCISGAGDGEHGYGRRC